MYFSTLETKTRPFTNCELTTQTYDKEHHKDIDERSYRFFHLYLVDFDAEELMPEIIVEDEVITIVNILPLHRITTHQNINTKQLSSFQLHYSIRTTILL